MDFNNQIDECRRKDPLRVIENITIKSTVIIFLFLFLGYFLNLNENLIVLSFLYISNLSISVLKGDFQSKKIACFMYCLLAIISIELSPYVYFIFKDEFLFIAPFVYICFWCRKFGITFNVFPMMVVIVLCISFIKYPLYSYNQLPFLITSLSLTLIFYFFVLVGQKQTVKSALDKAINNFMKQLINNYFNILKTVKIKKAINKDIFKLKTNSYELISLLREQGNIKIKQDKKAQWNYFCKNLMLQNRLIAKFILGYKSSLQRANKKDELAKKEHIEILKSMERIFIEILYLSYIIIDDNNKNWQLKNQYIEHLKQVFKRKHLNQCEQLNETLQIFLFTNYLLIEDIQLTMQTMRKTYNEIFKSDKIYR